MDSLEILLDLFTAYNPQADGQLEGTIQILEDIRKTWILDFSRS